jgi:hypothetical protein
MDTHVGCDEGDIAAHDDEVALGQVLDVGHAPDQRQPIGDQSEDRADQDAVQQQLHVQQRRDVEQR